MTTYNYYQEVTNDIVTYLNDNFNNDELIEELEFENEFINRLNDDLFIEDSITGNASGSYTFNRFEAKEYVLANIELLKEAYECFDSIESLGNDFVNEEYEKMDVTIRCYVLGTCIGSAIDEILKSEEIQKLLEENEIIENIYRFMDEYDFYNLQEESFELEDIKNALENTPYGIIEYIKGFENEKGNAIINSINKYLLKI